MSPGPTPSGSTLLLTRPRQQAADWLQRLAALGVQAHALPLLEIAPALDPGPALEGWRRLPEAALAMFVSPNAVEQFFALRPAQRRWPAQTLAATVGPGSAQALLAQGVPQALLRQPPADAASLDSEHLWPLLEPLDWQGRLALVLRGEGGRDWLAERLRERGAEVLQLSVYRRGCPQLSAEEAGLLAAAVAAPGQHVWLFSSSEAAGHLRQLAPAAEWSAARAIATHPRIADSVRQLGFGHVVLARPDAQAIANALSRL
ncbi:uroporphyrinogen-III synthase [Paucibacter sp. APW11]|uniref:Uroporphyrinogen-III synthase n=1 Tax=Roseateles aquae TaxID=3077235 RepID=A0ABU3P762_9BURK|nr:uroporphyrinogen-III synthase [Paucibacter sp. APW11]MDT8998416.1 uroporphyrinogen-III synthase [Paucibacter sp. APW11]